MTTTGIGATKALHPWSKAALLAKAQRYAHEMLAYSRDDWRFGLLSTFVLEFLARAALANISPALLADPKSWNNLYFSLGHSPTTPKFIPKSIDTVEVFIRLRDTVPSFTTELEGFSVQHVSRRNEELHTGSLAFDGLSTSWLSRFYETAEVLLTAMADDLSSLVGDEESKLARQLIVASKDESAKAVAKAITAHKTVWESKEAEEKAKLMQQASVWSTRQNGHRVVCPACTNKALVRGEPISQPIRKLDGDLIVETQEYLPSKFECVACQLKIAGLSQLSACGLGSTYKSTSTYDAA
jgi:hypothetical protein